MGENTSTFPSAPRVAIPKPRAGLPLHLLVLLAVEVLARLPGARPEGRGRRDRGPCRQPRRGLLHPRRRGTDHQQEEVRGLLPGTDRSWPAETGEMGHQHPGHRHLPRPRPSEVLPQGRTRPCLARHRGGGADEARRLQQGNQGRGEQDRDPASTGRPTFSSRPSSSSGLDNETPETLEETYRMAWDWQPDLANWSMYTPWPFTPLFPGVEGPGGSV